MIRSAYGTKRYGWFHVDLQCAKDYTVDAIAKRIIAVGALVIMVCGSVPLLTSVHGQQPSNQLEYEVQTLRERVKDLDNVPTEIALIVAQQKVEADWHREDEEFKGKIVYGMFGLSSAVFMALFGWILQQFGIKIGTESGIQKRREA